jgi:hypothetical protein
MSFTKSKYDVCFMNQQQQGNKSVFDYVVNSSRYVNKNECNNYTPPFLTYVPSGVQTINVDIENELKGITRPYTKCDGCKYNPQESQIQTNNLFPQNKKECAPQFNILPQGYIRRQ